MGAKLYVGNLSYQVTEQEISELFATAGTVASVKIITDNQTGRARGFGFVEMGSSEDAQKAVEMFNGKSFKDRNLIVSEARPQQKRERGGGGYGGGGYGGGGYGGRGDRGR
ncbi:MAG: RNA-binding protein [Nitrospirae bacterium]|nr:RNA-binding protein [Nitrospirota bacterium]